MILIASLWKKRMLLSLSPLFLAVSASQVRPGQPFQPPAGILTVGLRETARHRAPIPVMRLVRGQSDTESVTFWVHVDDQGNVIEVRELKTNAPWQLQYSTDALVEAISKITYQPFVRKGTPVEA